MKLQSPKWKTIYSNTNVGGKKWKKSRGDIEEQRLKKELFLKNKSGGILVRSFNQQINLFSLRFRV